MCEFEFKAYCIMNVWSEILKIFPRKKGECKDNVRWLLNQKSRYRYQDPKVKTIAKKYDKKN